MGIRYEILEGRAGLEEALELRLEVFVREQSVPEEIERDELDDVALHAVARLGGRVVATGRLVMLGNAGRIGRMAVARAERGHGLGRAILELLVGEAARRGARVVRLHAQCHARNFYARVGFADCSGVFLEAGIEHVEMEREL